MQLAVTFNYGLNSYFGHGKSPLPPNDHTLAEVHCTTETSAEIQSIPAKNRNAAINIKSSVITLGDMDGIKVLCPRSPPFGFPLNPELTPRDPRLGSTGLPPNVVHFPSKRDSCRIRSNSDWDALAPSIVLHRFANSLMNLIIGFLSFACLGK